MWCSKRALTQLQRSASRAIQSGYTLLILSDRGVDPDYAPIPSLLALTAVHNHLVREETRTQVALIIESGWNRARSCTLKEDAVNRLWQQESAVNPYLALETVESGQGQRDAVEHYKVKSIYKGLLKTFSKMGIS